MIDLDNLIDLAIKSQRPRIHVRDVKDGSTYVVISYGDEYHLANFAWPGECIELMVDGVVQLVQLQFAGDGSKSRYAGKIVVYRCDKLGRYWMRPVFEFYDGRYERIK